MKFGTHQNVNRNDNKSDRHMMQKSNDVAEKQHAAGRASSGATRDCAVGQWRRAGTMRLAGTRGEGGGDGGVTWGGGCAYKGAGAGCRRGGG